MSVVRLPVLKLNFLCQSLPKVYPRLFHSLCKTHSINFVKNFTASPSRFLHYGRGVLGLQQKQARHLAVLAGRFVSINLQGVRKFPSVNPFHQVRCLPTLNQIMKQKPRTKRKKPKVVIPKEKRILIGPQRKGVCVKLVVRTPKKPNSAQRKCAILRLSNGKLITAYIPGEKGNLQEHGVVLFEGGRVQDCPGIKYKIIRRKYDMN